jgi:hypothetical protein
MACAFLTAPFIGPVNAMAVSASPSAPSSGTLTPTEQLLAGAEHWAARNGTNALFVDEYYTWLAHGTTDGANLVWFPEDMMIQWRVGVINTLHQAGMNITCTGEIPENISSYDLVVITSFYACEPRHVPLISSYISNGGGVILIGMVPEFFRTGGKSHHTWYLNTDPLSYNNYQWMGFAQYTNTGGSAYTSIDHPFGTALANQAQIFVGGAGLYSYAGVTLVSGTTVATYDTGVTFAVSNTYGSGHFYFQAELVPTPIEVPIAHAHGTVLASGNYPMANAIVSVDDHYATETDQQGNFTLATSPGGHNLTISKPGYYPLLIPVEMARDADLDLGTVSLTANPAGMGLVRFSDGGDYSLLIPQGWAKSLNLTVSGTTFLLKLEGPQEGGVSSNILLESGRDDGISDLTTYKSKFINETIGGLAEAGVQATVLEQPRMTNSGADQVMIFTLQYASGSIAQKMGVVYNQTTHQYWIIICTTSGGTYQEQAPVFDQVIASFQAQGTTEYDSSKVLLGIAFIVIVAAVCVAAIIVLERKKKARRP